MSMKRSSSSRDRVGASRPLAKLAIGALSLLAASALQAAVVTIPQSALVPSTQLYTDDIGGGIGSALVMTGGGNAANVGGTRNDDGYSGPINFGFNFTLFGNTYTSFYANNNGNISFTQGLAQFTPTGPQGASVPLIAPFFADVDTRNAASGVMSLRTNSTANGNEVIITWPNVGYYSAHGDLLNTFQLVVRADDYIIPAGEGQVGFFWGVMDWETGDASGGSGGFGGTPAAVGFGLGDGVNGYVLQGSIQNGISNVVENHRLWVQLQGGVPVVVPEPGTLALVALAALGLGFSRRRTS